LPITCDQRKRFECVRNRLCKRKCSSIGGKYQFQGVDLESFIKTLGRVKKTEKSVKILAVTLQVTRKLGKRYTVFRVFTQPEKEKAAPDSRDGLA
jgi:hypothetical protein